MLQRMRKYTKSWISSIFLGALALSFGVWGVADIFRGNTDTTVATVGDVAISQDSFQHEYQSLLRTESRQLNTELTPEQARAIGLPKHALNQIIDRTAIDSEVQRLGLTASDKNVANQIKAMSAFAGPTGSFDHATFLQQIQQVGFTEQSFIDAVRSDTARAQLLDAASSGLAIPTGYARALFDFINEQRAVNYVVVPPSAAGKAPKPTDAQLEAFVKAHASEFSTPQYRGLTYAEATPDQVVDQISVTDKQLHNQYELDIDKYKVPEKRDIEQITFPDKKTAEAASAKIAAGTSFDDIAKSRGLKTSDIQLGELQESDLGGARGKAAFALKLNDISKPVKGTFGWVIMKVTKITPGTSKTFDEVKDTIKKKVMQTLAVNKITDMVNAFEDAMAGGDTLVEAAKKAKMKIVQIKAVDKDGMTPAGTKADVPANPQFMAQVFQADTGVAGDPFQTTDGSAYVLKVEGVTPSKLKPLDQVRAKAEAEWTAEQQQNALEAKAKALAAEATKDKSLDAIAKSMKLKIEKSSALSRGLKTDEFPVALMGKIFDAKPGTAVYGKATKGGAYIVARITGVAHPPASLTADPRYNQFISQIGSQVANDIPNLFATAARKRQGVSINQKMVDAVTGAGS